VGVLVSTRVYTDFGGKGLDTKSDFLNDCYL